MVLNDGLIVEFDMFLGMCGWVFVSLVVLVFFLLIVYWMVFFFMFVSVIDGEWL